MNRCEAEESLHVIRTMMERSTRYTNLSGHAGIAAGLMALAGALLRHYAHTPFLLTWSTVFLAACASTVYFTARMARANGEPFWSPQARTAFLALTPALTAAILLTLTLERAGRLDLLPGTWMLLWGVGALAMGSFTPRVIASLGLTFLVVGGAVLALPPLPDSLLMGGSFGLLHLVFGAAIALARRPSAAGVGEAG